MILCAIFLAAKHPENIVKDFKILYLKRLIMYLMDRLALSAVVLFSRFTSFSSIASEGNTDDRRFCFESLVRTGCISFALKIKTFRSLALVRDSWTSTYLVRSTRKCRIWPYNIESSRSHVYTNLDYAISRSLTMTNTMSPILSSNLTSPFIFVVCSFSFSFLLS